MSLRPNSIYDSGVKVSYTPQQGGAQDTNSLLPCGIPSWKMNQVVLDLEQTQTTKPDETKNRLLAVIFEEW